MASTNTLNLQQGTVRVFIPDVEGAVGVAVAVTVAVFRIPTIGNPRTRGERRGGRDARCEWCPPGIGRGVPRWAWPGWLVSSFLSCPPLPAKPHCLANA